MRKTNNVAEYLFHWSIFLCAIVTSHGHGRLLEPPSRASMWRLAEFNTPVDYNDNQLYCGGFNKQWNVNGGRCGVCGDDYSELQPRKYEGGGTHATGTIARTYLQGQTIDVLVQITVSHMGWFEFRLCPHNSPHTPVSHECLNENLLVIDGTATRTYGITSARDYTYTVQLPPHVVCSQCVFQWKYHTGNSWGVDPVTGASGLGYGPQEEFYGCSDITILSLTNEQEPTEDPSSGQDPDEAFTVLGSSPSSTWITATPTTAQRPASVTRSAGTQSSRTGAVGGGDAECVPVGVWLTVSGMYDWCRRNCAAGYCPSSHCTCTNRQQTTTSSTNLQCATPTQFPLGPAQVCFSVGVWVNVAGMDEWCQRNCEAGFCPSSHCCCANSQQTDSAPTTNPSTNLQCATPTQFPLGQDQVCFSVGVWVNVAGMDEWCQRNCEAGFCPSSHCCCTNNSHQGDAVYSTTTSIRRTPDSFDNTNAILPCENASSDLVCSSVGEWVNVAGVDEWCQVNCNCGYCPSSHCSCINDTEEYLATTIDGARSCRGSTSAVRAVGRRQANRWCHGRCERRPYHRRCNRRCVCS